MLYINKGTTDGGRLSNPKAWVNGWGALIISERSKRPRTSFLSVSSRLDAARLAWQAARLALGIAPRERSHEEQRSTYKCERATEAAEYLPF